MTNETLTDFILEAETSRLEMKSLKENSRRPIFYKGYRIVIFSILNAIKYFIYQNREIAKSGLLASLKSIKDSIILRKRLSLTKLIKFNNRYYSSPVIPSYPSNAFNNMIRNGGQNFLAAGTLQKRQIDSAFVAITNKCNLNCKHCYEKLNLYDKAEVSTEKLIEVIHTLQSMGTSIIILTGGEPLIELDKLSQIMSKVDLNLSEFHIHTSGCGITLDKAKKIKELGISAVAVGLDNFDEIENDKIRGKGAFKDAIKALKIFNQVGILTYVNLCATNTLIRSRGIWKYYELVNQLNVSIIQLLEPRPCGGLYRQNINKMFNKEDKNSLVDFMKIGNGSKKYKNHPLIYYVAHIEGTEQMGCMMGGLSHFYIDSKGNVNPCVFLPVSFGNIYNEDFYNIYEKMRKLIPHPVHKECPSLTLSNEIAQKTADGIKIPIPIEDIAESWEILFDENKE